MDTTLEQLSTSLDELAARVLSCTTENRTLREITGWNAAVLTRQDLSAMASTLAGQLRETSPESIDDETLRSTLADFPRRLKLLHADVVPHLFDGNAPAATPVYVSSIEGLRDLLTPVIGWVQKPPNDFMPAPLARRLRSYKATLDGLAPDAAQLGAQLKQIQEATEAAESLPTDLQTLAEARQKVTKFASDAAEQYGVLDQRKKDVFEILQEVTRQRDEANKLVAQCSEAYRITTTTGLAAAFDQRAKRIGVSMWVWVFGLLAALGSATYLGAERVKLLTTALSGDPKWGVIWMQATLSILSVGAPLWFAWVATKQIAQRFRLAEDYGFKASVAKAYEGYRREAARIDPEFESRLFSSALTRLEEAPLRLVEISAHGSPWHELMESNAFKEAIKFVPDLRDKVFQLSKRSLGTHRTPPHDKLAPTDKPAEA